MNSLLLCAPPPSIDLHCIGCLSLGKLHQKTSFQCAHSAVQVNSVFAVAEVVIDREERLSCVS